MGLNALGFTAKTESSGNRKVLPWLLPGIVVSCFLNLWNLWDNGLGHPYYAASVKSMSGSLHHFFYVAFDPGGFLTIDKPPLSPWLQTVFVMLLGFDGLVLHLPQALLGIGSVVLLFATVRMVAGTPAAALAALALALTPISVAVNRSVLPDALLAFLMTGAAYALIRSLQRESFKWLLICALALGLAFNTKSLEAFIALPAFWLAYLAAASGRPSRHLRDLCIASLLLGLVSLSWMIAFDLTPESQRPRVSGSLRNSQLDLALVYNGLDRLRGHRLSTERAVLVGDPQDRVGGSAGGLRYYATVLRDAGRPGALRLFQAGRASQVIWLAPLVVAGALASVLSMQWRLQGNVQAAFLIAFSGWLATAVLVFSQDNNSFHSFYLSFLAPAVAGLAGTGVYSLWQSLAGGGWKALLAPAGLLATAMFQIITIRELPYDRWLIPLLVTAVLPVAALQAAAPWWRRVAGLTRPAFLLGVASLLLAPAIWSLSLVFDPSSRGMPAARSRPESETVCPQGGAPPICLSEAEIGELTDYLRANRGESRYLVATKGAVDATPFILNYDEPVAVLGSFRGFDAVLDVKELSGLVADESIRYFLLATGLNPPSSITPLLAAIIDACQVVPHTDYWSHNNSAGAVILYDCRGAGAAIAAHQPSAAIVMMQPKHITPFTGTWKLNLAESRFNPGPPPFKSFTLTFTPDGTRTLDSVGANDQPFKVSLPWSDGKEVFVTIHQGTMVTSISTIQGNTFDETLKKNGEIVEKSHGVLSSDERTLTITVDGTDRQGRSTFHHQLIFEKQ